MIRALLPLTLASLMVISTGCSVISGGDRRFGATLADLPEPVMPDQLEPLQPATLDQIEESYRAALDVAKDPLLRHRILVRLADIEMARSENRQLTAEEEQRYFDDAIAMYDELLVVADTDGASEINDERLLYRLSKAYALDGRMTESDAALARLVELYPESPFAAEADFRRAEQAFNRGDYQTAQTLYQKVADVGDGTPFYINAVYMLGWSQFKDNAFRRSIGTFTQVLDRLIPPPVVAEPLSQTAEASAEASAQAADEAAQPELAAQDPSSQTEPEIAETASSETISRANQGLIDDTLRVMGITFTYLDGAKSITEIYQNLGERHYQHQIYQQLGNWYMEKELYQDASKTYTHYIDAFPNSVHGPDFAAYRMEVYKQGGFADELLPAKEEFVQQYGINSAYWAQFGETQHAKLRPYLETFLDELSSYYHAEGLALQKAQLEYERLSKAGKRPRKRPEESQNTFFKAAAYYAEYLETFPASPRKAEITFLMGEAYYEAKELPLAIQAYEVVAYELFDAQRGAQAGYAALIALQTLMDAEQEEIKYAALKQHKITSALNFADYYPADPKAVAVLTQAAEEVFQGGNQEQAVAIARRITTWQPPPERRLQKSAWLIIAHSEFDAADYTNAELSYRQVLSLLEPQDQDRVKIVERIAASMFKGAEQKAAAGETALAVEQLLQIEFIAPGSELAVRAQYDAGNYLMDMKNWQRAESVFVDFGKRFPDHELTKTISPKLAFIYQETKQWSKAAAVLALMASSGSDPESRRQSLYLSAELYQKAGRLKDASGRYEDYVKRYPEPFDLAIEARYQLLQIATERNDRTNRNYWLSQLIKVDAKAGSKRTERSKYLAAYASNEFARQEFAGFERIKLTLPIKKSLKAKKQAMDKTLRACKKVLDYGVGEFTTEANYRIGNVYSQLSRDLMNSERPKGLDDLALEQYEILLEEQAYPFEEKSVELLQANAERSWDGFYDKWVKQSFEELAKILPARYGKKETTKEVSNGLR